VSLLAFVVAAIQRNGSAVSVLVTLSIQGHSADERPLGSHSINRLRHLPVTAVATLDGVRGRWSPLVVQEGQRFLQVRRVQPVPTFPQTPVTTHPLTQPGPLGPCRVRVAAAVEQTIHLVHDGSPGTPRTTVTYQTLSGGTLRCGQGMTDEPIAMLEEGRDSLGKGSRPAVLPSVIRGVPGASSGHFRRLRDELLAQSGQHTQDGLGPFLEDVKFANLMRDVRKHQRKGQGIQRRGIGRDPQDPLATKSDRIVQPSEEAQDVHPGRIVVQDFIEQATRAVGIDSRQHPERAVVPLVRSQVAGTIGQGPVQVVRFAKSDTFFSLRPPPRFGWWRRERRPGDPARGARRQLGMANRLPLPVGWPKRGRAGCNGCRRVRGQKGPR
jgi:hypothetical protein